MSLNQFTDLSLKPYMKINASAISINNIALPSDVSQENILTSQPVNLAFIVGQDGSQSLIIKKEAYFSSYGGSMVNVGNGTAAVVSNGGSNSSLNFGAFDGTNLTIAQTGYYYIDYNLNVTFPSGSNVTNFRIDLVKPGVGTILFNQLASPTSGQLSNAYSFTVSNSAIIKLISADVIALSFTNALSGSAGTLSSISLSLVLLDPISE